MYRARYVLVDQALCGGGMRSTACPSSLSLFADDVIMENVFNLCSCCIGVFDGYIWSPKLTVVLACGITNVFGPIPPFSAVDSIVAFFHPGLSIVLVLLQTQTFHIYLDILGCPFSFHPSTTSFIAFFSFIF